MRKPCFVIVHNNRYSLETVETLLEEDSNIFTTMDIYKAITFYKLYKRHIHLCYISYDVIQSNVRPIISEFKAIFPDVKIILHSENDLDIESVALILKEGVYDFWGSDIKVEDVPSKLLSYASNDLEKQNDIGQSIVAKRFCLFQEFVLRRILERKAIKKKELSGFVASIDKPVIQAIQDVLVDYNFNTGNKVSQPKKQTKEDVLRYFEDVLPTIDLTFEDRIQLFKSLVDKRRVQSKSISLRDVQLFFPECKSNDISSGMSLPYNLLEEDGLELFLAEMLSR